MIRKSHPLLGHPVDIRRLDLFLPVTTQMPITKVIRHNINDIRFGLPRTPQTHAPVQRKAYRAQARQLRLVGYSGGGTLAALLAARRADVCQLITVASNLDIERWASHHKVSPLWGSENPASYGAALQHLPQYHLIGGDDQVVPATIVLS